ncbi:MAG: 3'-5' exonuclease, partial [Halioglobus sp.]
TLGITVVRNREISESVEFKTRPQRRISKEAQSIHGITSEQAAEFESFNSLWQKIAEYLKDQLIVIHNASFDWPILLNQVARYGLEMPPIQGVFCSQKAAIPWAQAMNLPCSQRGPSMDTLTKALGVEDLRAKSHGIHGAAIDSQQAAQVTEVMRRQRNREWV